LCWQNDPQYLATPHPLHVSVADLPQFQQFVCVSRLIPDLFIELNLAMSAAMTAF
jgi:hypothetical protein